MSYEENGLVSRSESESISVISNFSSAIVDELVDEVENNNCQSPLFKVSTSQGLPQDGESVNEFGENDANLVPSCSAPRDDGRIGWLKQQNYLQLQSSSSLSPSHSSLEEGTSFESGVSTVSFLTEIEVASTRGGAGVRIPSESGDDESLSFQDDKTTLTMESSAAGDPSESTTSSTDAVEKSRGESSGLRESSAGGVDAPGEEGDPSKDVIEDDSGAPTTPTALTPTEEDEEGDGGEEGENDEEDEDTTTLSSEAVVDDIELILMPDMCQDLPESHLSPKLVRVTELKVNIDDVFCDDDDDDEDQSGRHEFRSIVDEASGEEETTEEKGRRYHSGDPESGRLSFGDEDEVSSGSELTSGKKGARSGGESSKSSFESGRRRRSTSGRISSGVQTDITALEEPSALSGYHHHYHPHGFRRKSTGKSARLGLPSDGGGSGGKKLNWKSELTLLPSKMKVKQAGFNSFEANDERDQYSPRVAKFTSQDTLNLSSQFLKPSTLYRTRNLSRNLNQFASSESTFMLPMSSEQQLSAESPRFRDRMLSSTSGGGNFKGTATSHSYSAYQISSMLSGIGVGGGSGMGYGGGVSGGGAINSARRPPLISSYSGSMMMMSGSRHFRSSMPDLNSVNKSYGTMGESGGGSQRRRPPSKSIKHHHSSSGFRLQKRSSSDEETSSLIDESERCLRSSIDLLLTDELPSPGGDSCFRSTGFGSSSLAATTTGFYSSRRSYSQPILNDQAYPPEMKDPSMGSPFLPRKLSDMRISRWAKVILPNGHVAIVAVKETDEIQDSLTVHTDTGCVINLPFRKVVFAWKARRTQ